MPGARFHSIDYRERDGHRGRSDLLNRGLWVHRTPRLIPVCRIRGHRPVIDGTEGYLDGLRNTHPGHRWVCCDRCGIRPHPQGNLDPAEWNIGDPYTGPLQRPTGVQWDHIKPEGHTPPGRWPARPTGALGAQLVIGGGFTGFSAEVKVGNAGSEQTLAAHLHLGRLFALYLHTERHGTWLQRRLVPTGYESRVVGVSVGHGWLNWRIWAKRDGSSRDTPRWQNGSARVGLRDTVLGPRHCSWEDVGEPVAAVVRMPHGDDHQVRLKLQRQTDGRARGRKTLSWNVDWWCDGGIPVRPTGRGVQGSSVTVSDQAVTDGTWHAEATAAIAQSMTADRTRYGMREPA